MICACCRRNSFAACLSGLPDIVTLYEARNPIDFEFGLCIFMAPFNIFMALINFLDPLLRPHS